MTEDGEFYEMKEIDFYEYDEGGRRFLEQGVDLEELTAELRRVGCHKIGCIDAIIEHF